MAQRTIVWSPNALTELRSILEFYIERNQNASYSNWLYDQFESRVRLLAEFPEMGRITQKNNLRIIPFHHFGIIYKPTKTQIRIASIWDFRQNPNRRIDKR